MARPVLTDLRGNAFLTPPTFDVVLLPTGDAQTVGVANLELLYENGSAGAWRGNSNDRHLLASATVTLLSGDTPGSLAPTVTVGLGSTPQFVSNRRYINPRLNLQFTGTWTYSLLQAAHANLSWTAQVQFSVVPAGMTENFDDPSPWLYTATVRFSLRLPDNYYINNVEIPSWILNIARPHPRSDYSFAHQGDLPPGVSWSTGTSNEVLFGTPMITGAIPADGQRFQGTWTQTWKHDISSTRFSHASGTWDFYVLRGPDTLPRVPLRFDLPRVPLDADLPRVPLRFDLPTVALIPPIELPRVPLPFTLPRVPLNAVVIGEALLGWQRFANFPVTLGIVDITEPPVTGTQRWEIRPWDSVTWTDISDHIAGEAVMTEGADPGSLGGVIQPRASVMSLPISDADGFFDTPAGRRLVEPGARLRFSWGMSANDLSERYNGWLTGVRRTDNDVLATEWAGNLWRITAASVGKVPRLFRDRTLPSIFQELAEGNGIPDFAVVADADTTIYNLSVSGGLDGLIDVTEIGEGVVYDQPDGRIRMELPPTRVGKTVSLRWADETPQSGEAGIPRPHDLRQAFGVLNFAQAEIHIYAPTAAQSEIRSYDIPDTDIPVSGQALSAKINFDADALIAPGATYAWAFTLDYSALSTTIGGDTFGRLRGTVPAGHPESGDVVDVSVTNIAVSGNGSTVTITFDYSGSVVSNNVGVLAYVTLSGSVAIINPYALELASPVRAVERYSDTQSIARYGQRPRSRPLVTTRILDSPFPDNFEVGQSDRIGLQAIAQSEVERFATPIPVYSVVHSDQRTIRQRRISDKEHLRLRDGVDGDYFVEALETRIRSVSGLLQTVYYVAADRRRPRRVPLPPA